MKNINNTASKLNAKDENSVPTDNLTVNEYNPLIDSQLFPLCENLFATPISTDKNTLLWAVIDNNGKLITEFKYSKVYKFKNDEIIFNIGGALSEITSSDVQTNEFTGGIWGRIDKSGKEIGLAIPASSITEFKTALLEGDINVIFQKYNDWLVKHPNEFEIWVGDSKLSNNYAINPSVIFKWEKWKENRDCEENFIEINSSLIPKAYNLIDQDAISLAFEQFIREERVYIIFKAIPIINDYPSILNDTDIEFSINKNKELYEYYLKTAMHRDFVRIFNLRGYDYMSRNECLKSDLNKLLCIIEWVRNDHLFEWKSWAIAHNIWKQYGGFLRNGYASLYQSVFWKKHIGYYWKCDEFGYSSHPKGFYTNEFRRRLLINKLQLLTTK